MPPRARIDYLTEVGQARAHAIVMQKRAQNCQVSADTGCWLFTGSRNTDGYGQVSLTSLTSHHQAHPQRANIFMLH